MVMSETIHYVGMSVQGGRVSTSMTVVFLTAGISLMVMLSWEWLLRWRRRPYPRRNPQPLPWRKASPRWSGPLSKTARRCSSTAQGAVKGYGSIFPGHDARCQSQDLLLYRDKYDDTVSEAWAIGGALSYRSGWFLNHFGIGAVGYLSEPLYGPDDRDGTQLLKTDRRAMPCLANFMEG